MTSAISFVPPSTTTTTAADNSAQSLASNFDTFLTILTAQIQNQDPLEPLDSSQFTQQLVQFSGVEQQIRSNQSLNTLIAATRSSAGASLAGYLGQDVQISGSGAGFDGEPLQFRYALEREAATATISIVDLDGNVVYSEDAGTDAGPHDFTWNGETSSGETAPDGAYFIRVSATDIDGEAVSAGYSVIARVTGIDLSADEPAVTTTAGVYAYSDVLRFTTPVN